MSDLLLLTVFGVTFVAELPDKSLFASLVLGDMPPADGAATLTAFTAAAIARIVPLLPKTAR